TDGLLNPIWCDSKEDNADDGTFGFARYQVEGGQVSAGAAIVVINASERPRATSANGHRMKLVSRANRTLLHEGDTLVRMPIAGLDPAGTRERTFEVQWNEGIPEIELVLNPQTVNIYRVKAAEALATPTTPAPAAGTPSPQK